MGSGIIGSISILSTLIFAIGLLMLFISNPQTLVEVNNVSLAAYNLEGVDGRMWAVLTYLGAGLLNVLLSIGLLTSTENKSLAIAAEILLLVSGIIWLTFGLFPHSVQTNLAINFFLLRIIIMVLSCSIGLIIFGAHFLIIDKNKPLTWYTISSGLLIMVFSFMSAFVFDDATWIRTNVSLTIYFFWFGVFGATILRSRVKGSLWSK